MAKVSVDLGTDYIAKLQTLAAEADRVSARAVKAGAGVMADEIRRRIDALPEDRRTTKRGYWYLTPSQSFDGIPPEQKEELKKGLGITPVRINADGSVEAKVGFNGYSAIRTHDHPKGIPIPLIARATESGSSVRQKHPFVRPAVQEAKKDAEAAMQEVIDAAIENTMK